MWFASRLHVQKARILSADPAIAEHHLEKALTSAREQQSKWFELQAAIELARLWRDNGRVHDAGALLAPVYSWFTEGFDTPDLIEAQSLLNDLSATEA